MRILLILLLLVVALTTKLLLLVSHVPLSCKLIALAEQQRGNQLLQHNDSDLTLNYALAARGCTILSSTNPFLWFSRHQMSPYLHEYSIFPRKGGRKVEEFVFEA